MVHVNCTAHCCSLALSQSAPEIPYIKENEAIVHIMTFFHNSLVRYNRLKEMPHILHDTRETLEESNAVFT